MLAATKNSLRCLHDPSSPIRKFTVPRWLTRIFYANRHFLTIYSRSKETLRLRGVHLRLSLLLGDAGPNPQNQKAQPEGEQRSPPQPESLCPQW